MTGTNGKKRGRPEGGLIKYFQTAEVDATGKAALEASLAKASVKLTSLRQERCFNVQLATDAEALSDEEAARLRWLLSETYDPDATATATFLAGGAANSCILEVGPRLTFATAFSSNAVSICASCGLEKIERIECSRRYLVETSPALSLAQLAEKHATAVHDQMTECVYLEPLATLASDASGSR